MAENKVKYYVRIDDKFVEADMETAKGKISKGGALVTSAVAGVGAAAAGALAGATAAAITFGSGFETSMAKASTLIDTSVTDMSQLSDQVLKLSDNTGIAAEDLGNSMYNALSAGIELGDNNETMMAALESSAQLAKAGFTDIDTALSATAKTMNAYGLEGEDAMAKVQKVLMQTQNNGITTVGELGSVLSNVTPTAAAFGVSFEQVGAALSSMTAQGTSTASATTQLNSLLGELGKSGTAASKNLEKAAEGTAYAGMSFTEMVDAGVPLNEILDLMGTHAEENGLGMLDMFSSIEAGKAALSLAGENSQQFADNLAAMGTETDVVGEAFDKVSGSSAEQFAKMLNELKNVAIELYNEVLPLIEMAFPLMQQVLTGVIEATRDFVIWIKDAIEQVGLFTQWMQENEQVVVLVCIAVATLTAAIAAFAIAQNAATIATTAHTVATQIATAATAAFNTVLAFLTSPITLVILAIGALIAVIYLLVQNWEEVSTFLIETWQAIQTCAAEVWNAIALFFTELWQGIKGSAKEAWNSIALFFTELWQGISSVFSSSWENITGAFSNYIERCMFILRKLLDFVKAVFAGDWQAAWSAISSVFSAIADGMANGFKNSINVIIDAINGFLGGLNGIKIPDWVPGVGGLTFSMPTIPRLKKGMGFVPSDYFPAFLDYGERVLTKEENAALNAMGGMSAVERNLSAGGQGAPVAGGGENNGNVTYTTKNEYNTTIEGVDSDPDVIAKRLQDNWEYGV